MHDEQHPYWLESLDYPAQVDILTSSPWYDGTVIEMAKE